QMKVGRRLATKIINASRFVLTVPHVQGNVSEPLDVAMLGGLANLVEEATKAFEGYDYARALERTEAFFWSWCDDYLELAKDRAYAGGHGEPRLRRRCVPRFPCFSASSLRYFHSLPKRFGRGGRGGLSTVLSGPLPTGCALMVRSI